MASLKIETTHGDMRFSTAVTEVYHLDSSAEHENSDKILALLECWLGYLADSPLNDGRRSNKPAKTFRTFRSRFLRGPLLPFIRSYASLADDLMQSCISVSEGPSTGSFIPGFTDTPIFSEYLAWYRTGATDLLDYILTFCLIGKRLDFVDVDFNQTALRGWKTVEDRLSGLTFDNPLVRLLKRIMVSLAPRPPQDIFLRPKFGPGKVAEPKVSGQIAKSNNLAYDRKLDRFLATGPLGYLPSSDEDRVSRYRMIPDLLSWHVAKKVSLDISRVKFVPKDVTKSRTICMEPNSFMYFQQMASDYMYASYGLGEARRFIDVRDQSVNRKLAQYGSATGCIDTIDLSSASDSVSWDLVRAIFPRHLLYVMAATRTSRVKLPDGSIVRVKKFAPMGSAVCFPTQCLVFTSVVVAAAVCETLRLDVGDLARLDTVGPEFISWVITRFNGSPELITQANRFQPASIYGDDICVDSKLTHLLTQFLTMLGFEVNISKSFCGTQAFRESCGGYYWRGEDITPLRLRFRDFTVKGLSARGLAGIIAAANLAGNKRWRVLHRHLIQYALRGNLRGWDLRNQGTNSIRFTSRRDDVDSFTLYTTVARNTHLRRRYYGPVTAGVNYPSDPDTTVIRYQRDEYYCILCSPEEFQEAGQNELPALETYLYQRWWGDKRGVKGVIEHDDSYLRDVPGSSRLRGRWIPAE